MEHDTREISSIIFSIFSTQDVLNMSVCKIDSPKKHGYGTVYDERLGTTDSSKLCETCGENAEICSGHFGHIEFHEPIIHPLFYKRLVAYLGCFCTSCYRLLLTHNQIYLNGLNRYKGETRFVKIQEKIKKVDMCCHCGCDQPKCKLSVSDSFIYNVYENKDKVKTSVVLTTDEIKRVFDSVIDNDIVLLGFDPKLVHPKNLIMEVMPVMPICSRPFVKADGNICDDDISLQLIEVIKANNHLAPYKEQGSANQRELSETKRQKCLASLRFRVHTTFNNSQGKAKHSTNGRAIKSIKERLAGKDGQIRNNVMGEVFAQKWY